MKQNCAKVNLQTRQTECGELDLPDEKIKASATILANILLDYVRNGENTADLTPSKVFGQRRKQ